MEPGSLSILQLAYISETWVPPAKDPENRAESIGALMQKVYGRLVGMYYCCRGGGGAPCRTSVACLPVRSCSAERFDIPQAVSPRRARPHGDLATLASARMRSALGLYPRRGASRELMSPAMKGPLFDVAADTASGFNRLLWRNRGSALISI
jgi:hypothetical protein